ncbi:protein DETOXIFICATION 16 [Lolium perenne]|uniref:protein DETOXIFICATION 16 n=1 Tax=Lolium perenne TaxID=4522 RepID=UPI003A98D0C4
MEVGDVLDEMKRQLKLGLPISFTYVLNLSLVFVALMFVGHLSDSQHVFAGTALATSFSFVTGFSMMIGLSSALDTFCGQAFGAKEEASVGVHTQRAMLVLITICVPVSVMWNFTEPILIFIRQNRDVSTEAASYIRWLIPGLFGYALVQCQTRFLNNQRVVVPLMLSSLICSVLNVPLCWLLVFKSPFANKGAAMALSISYWFNAILLALYIRFSHTCKATWKGFSRDALHHVPQFLKLAGSSALMLCLRFWSLELLVLLSGILPDPKLETSAFLITRNTSSIVTMIAIGLSTSVSIRVSNELGAGRPKEARKVILIAFFIATSEGLSISLLLVLLRNIWGKLYSNETKVVKYVANILPLVAICHIVDTTQCLFSGTLRGCGLQKKGAVIILGTTYIIGVPLSVVLGFVVHLRAKGFWIGFIIALCVQDLIFGMLFLGIDWEILAAKAKERVHISILQKENVYNREGQTDIGQLKGIRSTVTEEDHVCPPQMP